jgi:hypothetical protein
MTSIPRATSPCASLKILPCSLVMIAAMLIEQLQKSAQDASASDRRRIGPVLGRRQGARYGAVGCSLIRHDDVTGDLADGGIEHLFGARTFGHDGLAANPVRDRGFTLIKLGGRHPAVLRLR